MSALPESDQIADISICPLGAFIPASPLRRRATSVEECTKKPRRNAALTLRACRYRGPSRQPSRLCCSGCLRTLPFPPYLGRAWWPICTDCPTCTYDLLTCTYDDLPTCTYDDLWIDNLLQVRTCLRVRTQKPMLLSQVSWSFSLDFTKPESTHHDCLCSKPLMIFVPNHLQRDRSRQAVHSSQSLSAPAIARAR
jgi:hypothetical protein